MSRDKKYCLFIIFTLISLVALGEPVSNQQVFAPFASLIANFDKLDANKNGVLDEGEVPNVKDPAVRQMLVNLDIDGDKKISRKEIRVAVMMLIKKIVEKKVQEAWQKLDSNQDGKITREEITAFTDGRISPKVIDDFFAKYDTNGDKVISSDERVKAEPVLKNVLFRGNIKNISQAFLNPSTDKNTPRMKFMAFVLDENNDGKVTREELISFSEKILGKETIELMQAKPAAHASVPIPDSSSRTSTIKPVVTVSSVNLMPEPAAPDKFLIPASSSQSVTTAEKTDGSDILNLLKSDEKEGGLW
ncbi:MAG: EF-hand domain-containing protein [Candidatus Riflebacteria bacterium]|nr:EF-hand domain-containing protein [Candidatus Riflebacteria bacterium]